MAAGGDEGATRLKVKNIKWGTQINELRSEFKKYGHVIDLHIPRDHESNRSLGYAYVTFSNKNEAGNAVAGMNRRMFKGRPLTVLKAANRKPIKPHHNMNKSDLGDSSSRSRLRSRSRSRSRRLRSTSRSRSRSNMRDGSTSNDGSTSRDGSTSESPKLMKPGYPMGFYTEIV